jgi:hypothetical protein
VNIKLKLKLKVNLSFVSAKQTESLTDNNYRMPDVGYCEVKIWIYFKNVNPCIDVDSEIELEFEMERFSFIFSS